MKILTITLCLFCLSFNVFSQKTDKNTQTQATEKHYDFLEKESKAGREHFEKENEAYRTFIQKERSEHQTFLEKSYTIAGIIVTVVLGILAFFGLNTFNGINKSRKDLEVLATSQLLEYTKAFNESQSRLGAAQTDMRVLEQTYQQHINYFKNANPKNGSYLLIGMKDKIDVMKKEEIPRFEKALTKLGILYTDEEDMKSNFSMVNDVVIYRSNADKDGEDLILQELLKKLKDEGNIPILIYAKGQPEHIKGNTDKALNEYGLFHMATNPVTLIENTSAAYRVSKLSV
jgi:hypothetical protein